MKRAVSILVISVWTCLSAPGQSVPPEVQKLERYLGTWTYNGEDKTSAGGQVTCKSVRRWITGGFFVESHRECQTPRGDVTQVEVYGYDFQNRTYLYWGFNGRSVSTYAAPSLDGATVVWTGTALSASNRCRVAFGNDDKTAMESCETSRDGGKTWVIVAEGKSTIDR